MLNRVLGLSLIITCLFSYTSYAQYDISLASDFGVKAFSPNKNTEKNYFIAVRSFAELYDVYGKLGNLDVTGWRPAGSSSFLTREQFIESCNAFANWIDFEQQFIIVTVRRLINEKCCHFLEVVDSSFKDNTLRVILKTGDCYSLIPEEKLQYKESRQYSPIQTWVTDYGTVQIAESGEKVLPIIKFYEELDKGDLQIFESWDVNDQSIIGSEGGDIPNLKYSISDLRRALKKAINWNEEGEKKKEDQSAMVEVILSAHHQHIL